MENCDKISACELIALASTLSCIISKNLNIEELNIVGDLFSAIGSNISMIADVKATNEINLNNNE